MMTLVFNSGTANAEATARLKELSKPVAYFEGAPKLDFAFKNVSLLFASNRGLDS